ncbi:MAG: sugar phosphate isomerase/epimerase [Gammaproteobacteria bacterium]|jgi:sugar phosphate isomerase/epimerase
MEKSKLSAPEFIATYWTHAGKVVPLGAPQDEASPHDFRLRVEAAGRAGYRGFGLMHSDLMNIRQQYSFADMKTMLDDNGLVHIEFEFVVGWLEDGANAVAGDQVMRDLLEAAAALDGRHIKIGPDMDGRHWPLPHMIERFSGLCERAKEVGTGIGIEIMPWSNIATVTDGVALVEGAGRANGGLLIDIWHIARGNIPYADVAAIPAGLIHHVELNDAREAIVGTLIEDTLDRRLHCGFGDFDVPRFIAALDAQGYQGPVGIEIISAIERERPFSEVLSDAISSAKQQYVLSRA